MMEKKSVLEWLEMYALAGLKSANRRLWQTEITRLEEMGFTIKAKPTNRRSEYYCVIDWHHPKPNTVAMTMLEMSEKEISSQS